MFARSVSPGPDHELFLAIIDSPFGARAKDLGKKIKVSPSTVSRRLSAMREGDWLATLNAHGQPVSPRADTPLRDASWVLNLDRPGIDAVLEFLHIEYGAEISDYRARLKNPYSHRSQPFEDHLMRRQATGPTLTERAQEALHSLPVNEPIHPRFFRAFTVRARQVLTTPHRLESIAQALYHQDPKPHAERYRDFIHFMIHLAEDLPSLPAAPADEEEDARAHLVALAVTLDSLRKNLETAAEFFTTSDTLGYKRARLCARIAEWNWQKFTESEHRTLTNNEAAEHLAAYGEINREISAGYTTPTGGTHSYVRYGGTSDVFELGTAGESFIAHTLRSEAESAEILHREVTVLPGVSEALAQLQSSA